MLSVVMLNVVTLSVVKLNVIMLSIVAQTQTTQLFVTAAVTKKSSSKLTLLLGLKIRKKYKKGSLFKNILSCTLG